MGNLIVNFLREQGILIIMGWMLAGGIVNQILYTRRYRKLKAGLHALAGRQTATDTEVQNGADQNTAVHTVASEMSPKKRTSRRSPGARRKAEQDFESQPKQTPESAQELDAQLLYLKQSLDRIAAGRDQKLEEEVREHRKLTPEQEAVIADILKEYLS